MIPPTTTTITTNLEIGFFGFLPLIILGLGLGLGLRGSGSGNYLQIPQLAFDEIILNFEFNQKLIRKSIRNRKYLLAISLILSWIWLALLVGVGIFSFYHKSDPNLANLGQSKILVANDSNGAYMYDLILMGLNGVCAFVIQAFLVSLIPKVLLLKTSSMDQDTLLILVDENTWVPRGK